ncbi:MAG: aminotransferase class V-fold PLP-dependent enzyme [Candidatus Thalassarchaeaceae archaeon]|nr:aminotransferase class V-fold PLP-dependent enzyme [Candidatus Thalassarchaeaceae archaeon]|tara:strand:+ start:4457 stop:5650 length:1194 start_codon:yes stop_codon:yes gene_type:complete
MIPRRSDLSGHWSLDENTVFLNHGSFGATPIAVMEEQQRLRERLESDPVLFVERISRDLWWESILAISEFMNAEPDGMTFVTNATAGVNTVLRSLVLNEGDEILVPNHAYQACWNAIDYVTSRSGAKTVVVDIPFRVESEDEVVNLILDAVTENTVLALIDTVTSPTGLRMPFEKLVRDLQHRGVDVLLDAAHGPGIVPIDVSDLRPAYITGNCHKWICTPKGSAFLHIREDRKKFIKPLNISHGFSSDGSTQEKFRFEFDWPGTQDPTPWLCIPFALEYLGGLVEGGWPEIMEKNRNLAIRGREILCEALETTPPTPESMISSLAAVEFPWDGEVTAPGMDGDPIHNLLYDEFGIQVPVMAWTHHGTKYIRISAQLYNHEDEYIYLGESLKKILDR